MSKTSQKSFTLIEILLYVSIFSVAAGLMTGIMTTLLKVSQRESALVETTSQLDFVMQTISRLVRESSAIIVNSASTDVSNDGPIGVPQQRLVLRMKDSGANPSTNRDPIIIYATSSVIKISEGATTTDLTSSRVNVDQLQFTKFTQYPGHDTVSIDIQFTYNSQNPNSRVSRTLRSAIARVSAATFDSNLLPGADNTYDFGYSPGTRWKNAAFSGDLLVGGNVGIGTTNPGAKLDVRRSGAGNIASFYADASEHLRIQANTSGGATFIYGMNSDDVYLGTSGIARVQINNDGGVSIGTEGFARTNPPSNGMIIEGNVGIGTPGPSGKLDVIRPGASDGGIILRLGDGGSATTNFDFRRNATTGALEIQGNQIGNTNIVLAPTSGNVGIGTTAPTPTSRLTVQSAGVDNSRFINQSSGAGGVLWVGDAGCPGENSVGIGRVVSGGTGICGGDLGADIVIRPNGNVGIGTTSPGAKLEVAGNAQISGTIRGATYGFGGFFQRDYWNSACVVGNPFTGSCGCPSGFTEGYFGRSNPCDSCSYDEGYMYICYK